MIAIGDHCFDSLIEDKEFKDKEFVRKSYEQLSSQEESKSSTEEIEENTPVDSDEVLDSRSVEIYTCVHITFIKN